MDIKPLITALGISLLLASTSFAEATRFPGPPVPPLPPSTFPEVEVNPLDTGMCVDNNGDEAEILHFAKIRFVIDRGPLFPRDGRDGQRLARLPRGIPLTVIVRHDPKKIHDVLGRVLAFLRARNDDVRNRGLIEIQSAEYSTECGTPVEEEPGPPRH